MLQCAPAVELMPIYLKQLRGHVRPSPSNVCQHKFEYIICIQNRWLGLGLRNRRQQTKKAKLKYTATELFLPSNQNSNTSKNLTLEYVYNYANFTGIYKAYAQSR